MPAKDSPTGSQCPISLVASVIFGRWTTEVLWALTHHGPLRFTQLRNHLPAVTPKVLAQRLRQLEQDGLITRTPYPEVPPRVEYEATPLAHTLSPIFADLERWSSEHAQEVETARRAYTGPLHA